MPFVLYSWGLTVFAHAVRARERVKLDIYSLARSGGTDIVEGHGNIGRFEASSTELPARLLAGDPERGLADDLVDQR